MPARCDWRSSRNHLRESSDMCYRFVSSRRVWGTSRGIAGPHDSRHIHPSSLLLRTGGGRDAGEREAHTMKQGCQKKARAVRTFRNFFESFGAHILDNCNLTFVYSFINKWINKHKMAHLIFRLTQSSTDAAQKALMNVLKFVEQKKKHCIAESQNSVTAKTPKKEWVPN